ncbi:DNA (cytosine-5)-methyltransferase 1 [Anaerovirgula multivorans]|uniref:Cytosine-specific methyltransferase n=1 Tax=Anaerovirgula multivorans TaxID=312168 RepID=A0A239GNU9_9FIRM|nr:DNA cytosine methyltransferase [Anaerovirgula multivorans]SNS70173.1 DNA (cytosine-5)-methyltransferase 1 [Anaerovirgula multivorans]
MNYLDLFAGAGGLSEGFARIGAEGIAHIELDQYAAQTLETRVAYYFLKSHNRLNEYRAYQKTYHLNKKEREIARTAFLEKIPPKVLDSVINMEISEETLPIIFEQIENQLEIRGIDNLDLIIGGPPCQAYSVVGRSRTGKNNENDSRHYLYKLYVQFLERFTPKAFVFENVPGIYTAKEGAIFEDVREKLENAGYSIKAYDFNAFDFGVPQNRKRVIIMGFRNDLMHHDFEIPGNIQNTFEVIDFFNDLPTLKAGETCTAYRYRRESSEALLQTAIRNNDDILTHHVARGHIERDLEIYREAVCLWNQEGRRLKYSDLRPELITHKNTNSFLDRFKVVSGNLSYSHTVVAHISKDGHHYIHPDIAQNRTITVREAARLQSFPDDYFFEGPRTANYVQVGNAVPPLMAERIARWFVERI